MPQRGHGRVRPLRRLPLLGGRRTHLIFPPLRLPRFDLAGSGVTWITVEGNNGLASGEGWSKRRSLKPRPLRFLLVQPCARPLWHLLLQWRRRLDSHLWWSRCTRGRVTEPIVGPLRRVRSGERVRLGCPPRPRRRSGGVAGFDVEGGLGKRPGRDTRQRLTAARTTPRHGRVVGGNATTPTDGEWR